MKTLIRRVVVNHMAKKCLIIINSLSGGFKSINEDELAAAFGDGFDVEFFHIDIENPVEYGEADRVVVCGGDGTLNSMINFYRGKDTELIYCPYGTLNETSKRSKDSAGEFYISDGGEANDKFFSYVLATGTFTPLGYAVNRKIKQKIKSLAYIANVFKQLRVWRINARLIIDGQKEEGQYSLIMALDSPQCFGLNFNKLFVLNDGKMQLLTIKAPRFNGIFGLIELFFPFFRAFFIGFKKPYKSKKMEFREVSRLDIQTNVSFNFCVDGEKWLMPKAFSVTPALLNPPVKVVTQKAVHKKALDKIENQSNCF